MQLLIDYTTASFPAWKAEFDADAENRMQAGLTLLQMWREADNPNAVACLFEVNDRARAQAWLDKEAGFGAAFPARFLKTA
jgi:hypothetical protein